MIESRITPALGAPPAPEAKRPFRSELRPHLTLLTAQVVCGLGNLLFALIAVRILEPSSYAQLASFLAAALLVQLPTGTLSAIGALDPFRSRSTRALWIRVSVGVALGVLLLAPVVSRSLDLPLGGVVAIAALLPGFAVLGVDRGALYGTERHTELTRSLLIEPTVRVVAGTVLTLAFGLAGAIAGVVLAVYFSLAFTAAAADADRPTVTTRGARLPGMVAAPAAFLVLALIQTQDLFVANARFDGVDAARFALLSTLGGAAVFATATVPLVLIPQLTRGRAAASSTAVVLTATIGLAITVGGALLARPLVRHAFGDEYAAAAGLLAPYLLAMTFLSVARVLTADRCLSRPRLTITCCAVAAAVHLIALLMFGRSPTSITTIDCLVMGGLALTLVTPEFLRHELVRRRIDVVATMVTTPVFLGLAALSSIALGLRVVMVRGLWVDEAISVRQAKLPFTSMIRNLAETDVHPPLHHIVLWFTVRVGGTSELAVRFPSILAGVALVPLLFLAGTLLFDRRTGWVAATLAVPAPLLLWYSQEARMYSLFMALSVAALCAQVLAIRQGRLTYWMAYAIATGALMWTQYFAILPFVVQQFAFLVVAWHRRRDGGALRSYAIRWAASLAVVALLVLPLMSYAHQQISGGASGWIGDPSSEVTGSTAQTGAAASQESGITIYSVLANVIWALWGYHAEGTMTSIAALWPFGMLLALLLTGHVCTRRLALPVSLVVGPLAVLAVIGSIKPGVFELRYASGAVPMGLLLLARLVTATTHRRVVTIAAASLAAATLLLGTVDQQVNSANPRRYDFAAALHRIQREAEPDDVILFDPLYLADVIEYYAPDVQARALRGGLDGVSPGRGVWLLAASNLDDSDALASRIGTALVQLEESRQQDGHFIMSNIEVWELR